MDNDVYESHISTKATGKNTDNQLNCEANEFRNDKFNSKKFCDNGIRSEWCCTKEASRILSITENAIRIMVHRGQIPVYKFGRRLRFKYADLESLFQKKGF